MKAGREWIVHCDRNRREGTFARKVKVTSDLRLECGNGARQERAWGNCVPMGRKRKCTDPVAVPTRPV